MTAITPRTRSVEQLDLTQPIWWVFYQTDSSRVWQHFTGDGAEARAVAHAEERASTLRRPVAVFPPQKYLKGPVTQTSTDIPLVFGGDEDTEEA